MHHGFHRKRLQSPAAGLSKRGWCCSAPSFEGKPRLRLCVAVRLAGLRGHAAPDRLKSQAWPSNLALLIQVPYVSHIWFGLSGIHKLPPGPLRTGSRSDDISHLLVL